MPARTPGSSERWLGDVRTALIHDTENATAACLIDDLVEGGFAVSFGSLEEAISEGHEAGLPVRPCPNCVDTQTAALADTPEFMLRS